MIVEITGTEEKIEGLIELLSPIGITELVRSGQVAMLRGDSPGIRYNPGANGHNNNPKNGKG